MAKLRVYLAALTILAMALAPLALPIIGTGSSHGDQAYASAAGAPVADNGDNGDDDADNNGGDNNGGDNNSNNNGNSNGNSNGNTNGNTNDNNSGGPPPSQPAAPAAPPAAACSTPGQEMSFQSGDGRVVVRVFGSMSQSVKFSIRLPIDPASVPPAPGPVVGGLLFQLIAETCDGSPLAVLPAEVNLGIHYGDADIAGLNEANFTIGRLDTTANQWCRRQNRPPIPAATSRRPRSPTWATTCCISGHETVMY